MEDIWIYGNMAAVRKKGLERRRFPESGRLCENIPVVTTSTRVVYTPCLPIYRRTHITSRVMIDQWTVMVMVTGRWSMALDIMCVHGHVHHGSGKYPLIISSIGILYYYYYKLHNLSVSLSHLS